LWLLHDEAGQRTVGLRVPAVQVAGQVEHRGGLETQTVV
jgi:hypothetical protein